jgi:hypothetical protein
MPPSAAMGRPKKLAGKKPAGPKTIGIRTTPEWADWLDRAVRHCRTDTAKFLDAAAAEYAKARGFTEPPPERIP